jgi:probable F420-dependent oxidoreductase
MASFARQLLSGVGIWSRELRYNTDRGPVVDAAAELEYLGYTALFIPDAGGDPLGVADELLAATNHITVATGILNIWMHEPADVVRQYRALQQRHSDRFVLGIGNSHAPLVNATEPDRYRRPVAKTVEFLDGLQAAGLATENEVLLAALGPRMLTLSAERGAGAHPYLVTADYIAQARELLGPHACLAPELAVVLETDPDQARANGRQHVQDYFALPNYRTNLQRLGYTDADFADGGSDRLVDDLVAWGDPDAIAVRVQQLMSAGADHVCIQVVNVPDAELPLEQWRALAKTVTA